VSKIFLKKFEDNRLKNGHLWVFSNEVQTIDGSPENGDIIEVCNSKGDHIGSGFYNKNSLIAVRLLSSSYHGNFREYAKHHLQLAYNLRNSVYPSRMSFRFCFSESDLMPGLIIDKYNSTFVLQVYSFGMQKNINDVISILKEEFRAKNVFSRNEPYFRKLEGLPEEETLYFGNIEEEIIDDGKIRYKINFSQSQKTGFYFDQCDNREFSERFVKDRSVHDAFCNSGGFGLHACFAGASSVDFLDSSEMEISNAESNYNLNNISAQASFIKDDVFDYLEKCYSTGKKYDVIILDPPAFAKNKKSVPAALKGYEKLNKLALQIINKDGYLITSSCSHHVSIDDFINSINKAASKLQINIQMLYTNGASLDHPQLPAMPETGYLKFAVFNVM